MSPFLGLFRRVGAGGSPGRRQIEPRELNSRLRQLARWFAAGVPNESGATKSVVGQWRSADGRASRPALPIGALACLGLGLMASSLAAAADVSPAPVPLTRLAYNNPGLLTDVGVGLWAWPLPMDYNGDGRMDLVVACTDKPSNGAFYFENTGEIDPLTNLPIFKPPVNLGPAVLSPQVSFLDGQPVVMSPGKVYPDFRKSGFAKPVELPAPAKFYSERTPVKTPSWPDDIRANEWRQVDYDGDGKVDLIIGADYWGGYNWENAYRGEIPAYDRNGKWLTGPLKGFVYFLRNTGTNENPVYAPSVKINAGDQPIQVFGMPSPNFADFRGTGKLDLICGEFIDGFTYFENIGTRTAPKYAPGRPLMMAGKPMKMDLCMITPVACDFNGDGHVDIVCGQEDGRVALIENTGVVIDGVPQFLAPQFFRQRAQDVKFGAISSPVAVDLDGDGLEDIVSGNTAGYIGFIKNLGGNPPRWAAPVYLAAEGKVIRSQAGSNGSLLGTSEAKWGYTNLSVADWDGDGRLDLVVSDIWGRVYWYRNVGTRTEPHFAASQPIDVEWTGAPPKPAWNWWDPKGKELVAQWRCLPYVVDWNHDGLPDLITLDPEGYLAFYERKADASGQRTLLPPKRIFWAEGVSEFDSKQTYVNAQSGLLRLNAKTVGSSGRRTFCFTDWDGDGVLDLLVNSVNINFMRGLGQNAAGQWAYKDMGALRPEIMAGHSTTPTMVHWNDPRGDLLFGAEDGFFYFLPRPKGVAK
jgi:hypothetical protein